jgi:biotin carboxyl carrier protein
MKKLRITVEGKSYDVTVETISSMEQNVAIQPTCQEPSSRAPSGRGSIQIPSPLAGKVISIQVLPGQKVSQGQQIIILEAMKMNTVVSSQEAGTVESVLVAPGDTVEEGQPLIRLIA